MEQCITRESDLGADVPTLELSAAGKAKGALDVAGGRHRYHAWKVAYDQGKKTIDKYEAQLAGFREKPAKGEKGKTARENTIAKIKSDIKTEQEFMDVISVWGVVVYDAGEYAII